MPCLICRSKSPVLAVWLIRTLRGARTIAQEQRGHRVKIMCPRVMSRVVS